MIVQLSDPHVGTDPPRDADALAAAVRAVLALPQAPDAVVVTGDLTDHGDAAEYAEVRDVLAALPMPVHVLPGNHDDRAGLRAAFGLDGGAADPIACAAVCGDLRLVVCDTTRPGHADGRLDLPWLAGELAADRETPTIVAMHHPPAPTGIPAIDRIGLPAADRRALADVLARAPQVRRVIAGHVHRSALATIGRTPVVMLGGTRTQLRLDFGADVFEMVEQPPLLAVHQLVDGELVSHLQPV